MSGEASYGYAVARIRAMEPLLLDQSVYQRMLDADGVDGALKVLGDTSYGKFLTGDSGSVRYDTALEKELLSTFEEFSSFVPERALVDIFRVPYDFHNVKVGLKSMFNSRRGSKKRYDLMTELGTVSTEKLMTAIETEDCSFLPMGLSTLIPECLAQWEASHDAAEMERMLDHAMYKTLLKLAESTSSASAIDWIRSRIDAENLRNLLRLRRFGIEAGEAVLFLHDGGTIGLSDLTVMYGEALENWASIAGTGIGDVLGTMQYDGSFDMMIVDLERALDDYCQAKLARARYSTQSSDNVLAYLWGKEQELKNIRTVMVSKASDTAGDEVRRLMRHGY